MKKFFIIFFIFLFMQNIGFCVGVQSTNDFPLELDTSDIPPTNSGDNSSDGLSGGAVTAITLGSIGGVALGGIIYWIYKLYFAKGMVVGCAVGCNTPLAAICLDKENVNLIIKKHTEDILLKKALEHTEIKPCPETKYILIPDTYLKENTFNTIGFEVPTGMTKMKIIGAFFGNIPEIKLYTNTDKENEIKLHNTGKNIDKMTFLETDLKSKTAALVLANKKNLQIQKTSYALVLEFSRY